MLEFKPVWLHSYELDRNPGEGKEYQHLAATRMLLASPRQRMLEGRRMVCPVGRRRSNARSQLSRKPTPPKVRWHFEGGNEQGNSEVVSVWRVEDDGEAAGGRRPSKWYSQAPRGEVDEQAKR